MITRINKTIPSALRGVLAAAVLIAMPAFGTPFLFSTGDVTGLMASAMRPDTGGVFEIESADDFVLGSQTQINSATFTGRWSHWRSCAFAADGERTRAVHCLDARVRSLGSSTRGRPDRLRQRR